MLNLNNIFIGSAAPGVLVDFYTEALGPPVWSGGAWVAWRAGCGFLTIGPFGEITGPTQSPGRMLFGFFTDDVVAEVERITRAGATVVNAPYHPVDAPDNWLAVMADPDGNYFQLWDLDPA